ncbi:MAG TPA: hypothetical protein VIN05_00895 [Roseovarius sp.]
MALQTRDLWMLTLGSLGDVAVNGLQHALPDGMHLRWSFRPEKGFPWYGYYLFRRPAQPKEKRRHCISRDLQQQRPGAILPSGTNLIFGTLESDTPISLVDAFPAAGVPEIDLEDRSWLRFRPPSPELAYWAEATIGFPKRTGGENTCVDFRQDRPGPLPNPFERMGARFTAIASGGAPAAQGRITTISGHTGWEVLAQGLIDLPCEAESVSVILVNGATPPKLEALDRDGNGIDAVGATGAGPEVVTLTGPGIASLRITAPQNETAVLRVCWSCRGDQQPGEKAEITVEGFYGAGLMASEIVVGAPGDVVKVQLNADAMDRIEIGHGPAVLIDLCVKVVSAGLRQGKWETLEGFDYPLCLPAAHADYPCPGKPANDAAAEALGLSRIVYGPSAPWAGAPTDEIRDQLNRLVVGGPPSAGGDPMHLRADPVAGSPAPSPEAGGVIVQQQQKPLDLLLLGTLQPPVAQMLGLYWYDKSALPGESYDYLLVADHNGQLGGSAASGLNWVNGPSDFSENDGFIAYDRQVTGAPPLAPPQGLSAYALPGSTVAPDAGGPVIDATNNSGLAWDQKLAFGILAEGAPVLYHVWRADLGNAEAPPPPDAGDFSPLTKDSPLPVGRVALNPPQIPPQPDEWPPFAINYIDRALADGWYAYQVNGVDLFGRHSAFSPPADWRQWTPQPVPRPWYYRDPPAGPVRDPAKIRLLDKIPPPPPPGVEAFALDPDDPTVLKDAAWQAWRDSLSPAERDDVIGLRVRWRWDLAQQRQAPDTREFRIYINPAPANALRGRVTAVTAAGATESDVVTDIAHGEGANAFAGISVRIGAKSFRILSSGAASPLRFRVKNIGPTDNVRPASRTRCTLSLPTASALFRDYVNAPAWAERALTVGFAEHVTANGTDRVYEVLLPVAGSADRSGLTLPVSLAEPMSAGLVGVTAADDRPHTPDTRGDPARFGNESRVGGPATVFRVLRDKPPAPVMPPDSGKVWASKADYHGRSYYTFRWLPVPLLKTFVYRAMDDAVVKADMAQRPRPALQPADLAHFPDEASEPAWDALKRQQVAAELNALNAVDASDPVAVRAAYGALSNDGLRVLAGLPGTERAFVQLTHLPLDPDAPESGAPGGLRWRRVGPDVAQNALTAAERAYVDTLDGKASNRYFYRCAYVDEVQNVGALGLSSSPVWLPDVAAPVAPRIARLVSGDRQVTVEWASNREPDLAEYRVYRAFDRAASQDIRLMNQVHSVAVPQGDPAARPKTVGWTDTPVPGLRDVWYRVVAVDRVDPDPKGGGGNVSAPSAAMRGRAFDQTPPDAPVFSTAEWVRVDQTGAPHAWTDPVPAGQVRTPAVRLEWPAGAADTRLIVQSMSEFDGGFSAASGWLEPGTTSFLHHTDRNFEALTYRLKTQSAAGNVNTVFHPTTLPPPA